MRDSTDVDFTQPMLDLHLRMALELGHNSTVLLRMVADYGGYRTAKILIRASRPSKAFGMLNRSHRLDLSAEAWILRPEYSGGFSLGTKIRAYRRLSEFGYRVPAESWNPNRDLNLHFTQELDAAA